MKQIGIYARVRMAFVVIGIAVMSAIGLAVFGRRAHELAPKLVRMIDKAEGPVTVMITGVELSPKDGTSDTWGEALHRAARAGAAIRRLRHRSQSAPQRLLERDERRPGPTGPKIRNGASLGLRCWHGPSLVWPSIAARSTRTMVDTDGSGQVFLPTAPKLGA